MIYVLIVIVFRTYQASSNEKGANINVGFYSKKKRYICYLPAGRSVS